MVDDHMATPQIFYREATCHKAHEISTPRVECALSPSSGGPSVSW